jgi:PAS domain S-box-containing protein
LSQKQKISSVITSTDRITESGNIRLLGLAMDKGLEIVTITDDQNHFMYVNDAFRKAYGYSDEEILGKDPSFLQSENNPQAVVGKVYQSTLDGGWSGEVINKRKDGSEFPIYLSTSPIYEKNGEVVGLIGLARDISDMRKAQRLHTAVYQIIQAAENAHSPDELFPAVHRILNTVMPADNFYIAVYDEQKDLLTFPYFVDKIVIPAQPRKPGKGLTEYVLRTGKPLLCTPEIHNKMRDADEAMHLGVPAPLVWLGAPLIVEGRTIGVMAVQHHTNMEAYGERELQMLEIVSSQVAKELDRKETESFLVESEKRFRALIEQSNDAIALLNERAIIEYVGPSIERVLGYSAAEFVGKNASDLLHPEERELIKHRFSEISHYAGMMKSAQFRVKHKDGGWRWIEGVAKNLLDDPSVNAIVINFRDITERRYAEEMLREMPKRIIDAQESERRRVARELHDSVNQILSSVKFKLEAIEGREAAKAKHYLERAIQEVRRISRNLRPSELDDLGVVSAVRTMCNDFFERTGIEMELSFVRCPDHFVPELELTVYRIIQEALTNVEKHSGAKKLSVECTATGKQLHIRISDNGKGYHRGKVEAAGTKNSGMGLLNMRERAAYVGGSVSIESTPRKGTDIHVILPIIEENDAGEKRKN